MCHFASLVVSTRWSFVPKVACSFFGFACLMSVKMSVKIRGGGAEGARWRGEGKGGMGGSILLKNNNKCSTNRVMGAPAGKPP